jgi:hypothetical protein
MHVNTVDEVTRMLRTRGRGFAGNAFVAVSTNFGDVYFAWVSQKGELTLDGCEYPDAEAAIEAVIGSLFC